MHTELCQSFGGRDTPKAGVRGQLFCTYWGTLRLELMHS